MRRGTQSKSVFCSLLVIAVAASLTVFGAPPRVHAIVGAKIVVSPGEVIDEGTVVFRDGLIESVGAKVDPPPDAVEIDGAGLWIYPGLIEPYSEIGQPSSGGGSGSSSSSRGGEAGTSHPIAKVRPEKRVSDRLQSFEGDRARAAEKMRDAGFTVAHSVPTDGIFRGQGAALLLLDDASVPSFILSDGTAQLIGFERGSFSSGYPNSLMGVVAAIRQVLLDTEQLLDWNAAYASNPRGMERPAVSASLAALTPVVEGRQTVFLHAESIEDTFLADRLAREFDLDAIIVASGQESEEVARVAGLDRTLIYPLEFPDEPELDDEHEQRDATLRDMRRYVDAPKGPARLAEAGVELAFTSEGLSSMSELKKNLGKILEAGLPEETALAAMTTVPARLLGIDDVVGTIEEGKIANLVLTDGPLFAEKTAIRSVFVDGNRYEMEEKKAPKGGDPNAKVDPRGTWSVVIEIPGRKLERTWIVEGEIGSLDGTAETQQGTVDFDSVELEGNMLTVVFPARRGAPSTEVTVVVKEDGFEGSLEMGPRSVPIKGTRTESPEGGVR